MSTNPSTRYDWLKVIPSSLLKLDTAPLFGHAPPFDWNKFAQSIKSFFQLKECLIEPSPPEWRELATISSRINKNTLPLQFGFSGLNGTGFWLMSKSDIASLMALLLNENEIGENTLDDGITHAFHEFLGVQVLKTFLEVQCEKGFSPHLISTKDFPHESALCFDINYQVNDHKFSGQLIILPELQQSFKQYYLKKEATSPKIQENLDVIISLEAGRVTLSREEWEKILPGDFILLDHCTIDPDLGKGRVLMTIHGTVLFRGMVKKGNIKILEHPLYHEVNETTESIMGNDNEFNDSEFEDSEYDESEYEDEEYDESEFEESEFEDSKYDDVEEDEYDDEELKELEESKKKNEQVKPNSEKDNHLASLRAPEHKKITHHSEIPLTIVVEIARLQMSVKQLSELQPGNLLELDVKPEDGVDLIINGKKIAKAELLKVGEALGVRILEI